MNDLVRRLATSQARGERQLQFINELLSFHPVGYRFFPIPGMYRNHGYAQTPRYGISRLEHQSWINLRKRLRQVGFVIETDREAQTVQLHFPELTGR